jgi:hypothetical protein
MNLETARASIGQQISNTRGVSQSNGPYLPPGSNFRLEFLDADNFGLSWQSPRGRLTLRLPIAALQQFVSRGEWLR